MRELDDKEFGWNDAAWTAFYLGHINDRQLHDLLDRNPYVDPKREETDDG